MTIKNIDTKKFDSAVEEINKRLPKFVDDDGTSVATAYRKIIIRDIICTIVNELAVEAA